MSDLTKVPHVLDSREVAKMVGMRHADLMRNISHYVDVISTNAKLRSLDFFIERDYIDKKGESRKRYDITKKGCEMVVDGDGLAPEVNVAPAQAERFADAHARMIKEQDRGVEHRPGRVCLQQCVKTLGRYDRPLDDLLGRFGRYADVLGWIATDDACRIDSVLQASLQDGERGLCRRVGQVICLHEVGCPLVNHQRRQILQGNVAQMRRDVVPHHCVIEVYCRVADARWADGMHPLVKEIRQQRLLGRDADAAMLPCAVRLHAGIEGIVLRRKAAFLDDLALAIDVAGLKAIGPCLASLAGSYSCHMKNLLLSVLCRRFVV